MNKLLSFCTAVAISGSILAPALAAPPTRAFNAKAFVGLAAPEIPADGNPVLDYDLDGSSGKLLHFTRCQQVAATPQQDVRTDQFPLWKALTLNCMAAAKYAGSNAAKRTYFPASMTRALVAEFPADSVPDIGGEDRQRRSGKTLTRHDKRVRISLGPTGTATAHATDADFGFTLLARADFDGDGLEDWLVRSEWSPRGARGSGADLVLLSRTTAGGPMRVVWRP